MNINYKIFSKKPFWETELNIIIFNSNYIFFKSSN